MATESDIIQRESGGNPNIGYGGVDLTNAPRDKTGFPIWEGKMGPAGISHAVGLHQWEPATWHEAAAALGLTDMSAKSQHEAFDYMHAKYGDAPWAASAPKGSGYSEGYSRGEQRSGGTYIGVVHPEPDTGNALLDSLLLQHSQNTQAAQQDTGNPLLNSIIKQTLGESPQQPKMELGGALQNLRAATPIPQGPQTVPELQAAQIQTSPMQPISAPAPARGAPPQIVPPQHDDNIKPPPPVGAPLTPAVPPMNQAPPLQHPAPEYIEPPENRGTPIAVQHAQMGPTGNGLLDHILKQASPRLSPGVGGAGMIGSLLQHPLEALEGAGRGAVENIKKNIERLGEDTYDPNKSFAENALNPRSLANSMDIAMSATGGGEKAAGMLDRFYSPEVKAAIGEARELDDDLFRASQAGKADQLEVQQLVSRLPDKLKGAADEQAYHERESRMTGKPLDLSETTKEIEEHLKPFDEKIHEDAQWLRENAPDIYGEMPEKPLRTAEEGHVHRKVLGMRQAGEPLDPSQGDIISGLGSGSLSRRASGMMHRSGDYVLEDNSGNRRWGNKGKKVGEKGGPRYGQPFIDERSGVRYVVKEPTTAEIEANTGRKYIKSLLGNTIDNYLRLSRVRRNVEILNEWKPRLQAAGHWMPEGSNADIPRGWAKVDVPQMRGYAQPHIAAVVNDLNRTPDGLAKINKFLIGTMFALPIRHQLNVAAHYAVGRGFDWVYRNPLLGRAATEVATQGPNYLRYLRAGAGLRYPGPLTENFYNTLLSKLFHDQMTQPEWQGIFKELGHTAADVVKAEYAWSRKALWKVNDIFLTARIMELEKAGKPLNEAIRLAEQEIPNYRLPVSSTTARKIINSPFVAFGRYGYGRAKALADTVKNLVGPNATGEERLHAIGQAVVMALGAEILQLGNHALQTAQKQIGNTSITGDKPLVFSSPGPYGPVNATARYVGSMVGLNNDQKNWASVLGSWITGSPIVELIGAALGGGGRNLFTGQQIVNQESPPLNQAIQAGEYGASFINPIENLIQTARKGLLPGLGPQFGIQQQYTGPPGRAQRYLRRQAGRADARDPIISGARRMLGQ
jgi:hypothetical protein